MTPDSTPDPLSLLLLIVGAFATLFALREAYWRLGSRRMTTPAVLIAARTRRLLILSLLVVALLPLNLLSRQFDHVIDLSALAQSTPTPRTVSLIERLDSPTEITAFLPPESDLNPILEAYFAALSRRAPEGKISFEILDQRLANQTARQLSTLANGTLVIAASDRRQQRLQLGLSKHEARALLANFDDTFQREIQNLTSSRRTVYLVQKAASPADRARQYTTARRLLTERLHLSVKHLPATSLLTGDIPQDAALLILFETPDLPADALHSNLSIALKSKTNLLIHTEPSSSTAAQLYTDLFRLQPSPHPIASSISNLRITRTRLDHYTLLTRQTNLHPALASFRDPSSSQPLVFATAAQLLEIAPGQEGPAVRLSPLVNAPAGSWEDLDEDYDYDPDTEERGSRKTLSFAISPIDPTSSWRAIATGDSSIFSDLVLEQSPGNATLLLDHVSWLIEDVSTPAIASDRRDRMLHLLAGPDAWLTQLSLALPPALLCLLLLLARLTSRRRPRRNEATS